MKTRFRVLVVVLVVLCLVLATAAMAAGPAEKQMERVGAEFDREAHFAQMFALQSRLSSGRIDLAAAKPLVVEITAADQR
ncbi:MAG TPA: hypothetical protein VHL59_04290, partial [Thermoanaerobaculia bacterium]|nr:hypothetical protein [Thermoanaerobaculia bacterium]